MQSAHLDHVTEPLQFCPVLKVKLLADFHIGELSLQIIQLLNFANHRSRMFCYDGFEFQVKDSKGTMKSHILTRPAG